MDGEWQDLKIQIWIHFRKFNLKRDWKMKKPSGAHLSTSTVVKKASESRLICSHQGLCAVTKAYDCFSSSPCFSLYFCPLEKGLLLINIEVATWFLIVDGSISDCIQCILCILFWGKESSLARSTHFVWSNQSSVTLPLLVSLQTKCRLCSISNLDDNRALWLCWH